ncbi:uncharacterized protein [Clytia hemisphaerica]|uniref:uncharacterized protein n=1 Tax=Clytia hemisphaerica TaxID=252671 RepID=UPI0034D4F081
MDLSFNRQQQLSFINKYLSRLDHLISVQATREEILKTGRQLSDTFRKFAAQEELLIEAGATDGKLLEEYQERVENRLDGMATHITQRNWANKRETLSLPDLPDTQFVLPVALSAPPSLSRFVTAPSFIDTIDPSPEFHQTPPIPSHLETPLLPQETSAKPFSTASQLETKPRPSQLFPQYETLFRDIPLASSQHSSQSSVSSSGKTSSTKSDKLRDVTMKKASEIAKLKHQFLEDKFKLDLQIIKSNAKLERDQIENEEEDRKSVISHHFPINHNQSKELHTRYASSRASSVSSFRHLLLPKKRSPETKIHHTATAKSCHQKQPDSQPLEQPSIKATNSQPLSHQQPSTQLKASHRQVEPCDAFIDELIEYKETEIPVDNTLASRVIQVECESRHLPPIELKRFDGSSLQWPEFIQNFKSRIHLKSSFNDTIRMERLLSVLDGPARSSIESIGTNSIFYATALKALKRDYGNPYVIAHLKLKEMFDRPQITITDHEGLRNFYQQLKTAMAWFESIGNSSYNNPETVAKAVSIIPIQHKFRFFNRYGNDQPKLTDLYVFVNWLECIVKELFNPIAMIISDEKTSKSPKDKESRNPKFRNNFVGRQFKCWLCSKDHKISKCPKILNASTDDRQKIVREKGLCFNCLSNNHLIKECPSKFTCTKDGCGKKHHTLLHRDTATTTDTPGSAKSMQCSTTNQTFLQIVPVVLSNGKYSIKTNAVLDSGSDSTLIRADTAEALHLSGKKETLRMSNVLSKETSLQSKRVCFNLESHDNKTKEKLDNVWVIENLDVPVNRYDINKVKTEFQHLKDITFPTPHDSDVTILIGADLSYLLVQEQSVTGTRNQPSAVKTKLGWMLFGGKAFTSLIVTSNFLKRSKDEISDKIERFWQMESYGTLPDWHKSNLAPIDQRALEKLEQTSKIIDNRMEVDLLWKEDHPTMPFNRDYAMQRLNSLEKRLAKDTTLARMYDTAIREFIDLGHARILTDSEVKSRSDVTNYIPHHGVTHPNKPGKVRVVFDAAAKFKGTSLNDKLLAGPDLLNSLVAVLHRFRAGRFAASADIEKMFNQVKVSPKDSDTLRFLYRFDPGGEVKDCILLFHVFGKKDSPCIANFALRSCAEETDIESIRDEILRNFYVDDYLGSFYTIEQLISEATQLNCVLSTRGFNLTKWSSNEIELIRHLPAEKISPKIIDINKQVPRQKTLGLLWDPNQDSFIFTVNLIDCEPTKRRILSQIGTIFDPLGFLTPVVLESKLIIQQLWKRKFDWDEPLPLDLKKRWFDWKAKIKQLDGVTVPRWCGYQPEVHNAPELHVFVDGSDDAYGAVAYLRFVTPESVQCSLVMSKSRLAPLKKTKTESTTTPALELQGAVIGSRMKTTILKETKFEIVSTTFWADSECTLKCIKNESTTFSKYVMNRLDEVRTNSDLKDWQFISGDDNPADDCTRYVSPFKLTSAGHRWFNGPPILHEKGDIRANDVLALLSSTVSATSNDIITNKMTTTNEVTTNDTTNERSDIIKWDHYSSWSKLKRQVAWLLKIKRNFRITI